MNANAMRTMFGRLGFISPGPEMLVVDQGINRIEELADLDDAEVDALLKLLRRPGGIIPNPNAVVAGQTANITAPGISVSMRAATHLKLSVYYCRHHMRTSRPLRTTDIIFPRIKTLKNLREEEESATDTLLLPKVDAQNWSKTLEAIVIVSPSTYSISKKSKSRTRYWFCNEIRKLHNRIHRMN